MRHIVKFLIIIAISICQRNPSVTGVVFIENPQPQPHVNDECTLGDNKIGKCLPAGSCKWAIDGIRQNRFTVADIVRCAVQGVDNVICCEQTPEVQPSRSFSACQKYIAQTKNITMTSLTDHILGGEKSLLGEFPHMAAIGLASDEVERAILWDCGASLISERFVLTAAHCVTDRSRYPTVVRMGKVTLNSDEDYAIAQDFQIEKIHVHPSYSSRTKYNDIALIRLQTKPIIDDKVRPACISFDESTLARNADVIIAGYGIINDTTKEKPDVLYHTSLQLIPVAECNQTLATKKAFTSSRVLRNGLNEGQLCAYTSGTIKDTCQGDSGGPLQINMGNISYVLGITSIGGGCGNDIPAIYTRVSTYLQWIEDIVWPNGVEDE